MPTLHLLGTGGAVTDPHRTTTMLAFTEGMSTILVDCGGDVIQRLLESGIDPGTITALVVTHEHPDHVSGFPLFMEKIWLHGRRRPIPVYGIRAAIDQAKRCFDVYDTSRWVGLPQIEWHEIAYEEDASILATSNWKITASPGTHAVPVVGVRVTSRSTGGVVSYSCDTEPSESIVRMSRDCDILLHEAYGASPGHSSASQAADVAKRANAKRLVLTHLPAALSRDELAAARAAFRVTEVGAELATYGF